MLEGDHIEYVHYNRESLKFDCSTYLRCAEHNEARRGKDHVTLAIIWHDVFVRRKIYLMISKQYTPNVDVAGVASN